MIYSAKINACAFLHALRSLGDNIDTLDMPEIKPDKPLERDQKRTILSFGNNLSLRVIRRGLTIIKIFECEISKGDEQGSLSWRVRFAPLMKLLNLIDKRLDLILEVYRDRIVVKKSDSSTFSLALKASPCTWSPILEPKLSLSLELGDFRDALAHLPSKCNKWLLGRPVYRYQCAHKISQDSKDYYAIYPIHGQQSCRFIYWDSSFTISRIAPTCCKPDVPVIVPWHLAIAALEIFRNVDDRCLVVIGQNDRRTRIDCWLTRVRTGVRDLTIGGTFELAYKTILEKRGEQPLATAKVETAELLAIADNIRPLVDKWHGTLSKKKTMFPTPAMFPRHPTLRLDFRSKKSVAEFAGQKFKFSCKEISKSFRATVNGIFFEDVLRGIDEPEVDLAYYGQNSVMLLSTPQGTDNAIATIDTFPPDPPKS